MTKSRDLANAATALNAVTAAELGFVDGVTSAIQTQLDAKATLTGTETFTNKTLTSPVLTTPTISTVNAKGDLLAGTADNTVDRLAVGSNGDTIVADSSTSTGLRYQEPKTLNSLINGGADIWQRGTSFASGGGLSVYTADRWHFYRSSNSAGATLSRQASGLTGFQYAIRIQRNSGNTNTDSMGLRYTLESADSYRLAGKTVTLSFYLRKGADYSGTNFVPYIASGTGTDQPVYAFTSFTTVATTTIVPTTSWVRYSVTGTVASNATEVGLEMFSYASGTAGTNDYVDITGLQLEIGSVPTPFVRSAGTIQGELAACQRYYERFSSATSGYLELGQSVGRGNGQIDFLLRFATTKRVTPTAVDYSGTINCATYYGSTALTVSSLVLDTPSSPWGGDLLMTMSSSATAGQRYMTYFNNNSTSYIGFSAEL